MSCDKNAEAASVINDLTLKKNLMLFQNLIVKIN